MVADHFHSGVLVAPRDVDDGAHLGVEETVVFKPVLVIVDL